jgi:hypothetical protein
MLIKDLCYYESHILGAHHGLISTYDLNILVLQILESHILGAHHGLISTYDLNILVLQILHIPSTSLSMVH